MSKKLRLIIFVFALCLIGLGLMMSFIEPASIPTERVDIPLNVSSSTNNN